MCIADKQSLKGPVFVKDIKTPDPVPAAGVARAVEIMTEGRMYRYNVPDANSEVSLAEADIAKYVGHKYAVGLNSCGSAIFLAMKCAGVQPGDKVPLPCSPAATSWCLCWCCHAAYSMLTSRGWLLYHSDTLQCALLHSGAQCHRARGGCSLLRGSQGWVHHGHRRS